MKISKIKITNLFGIKEQTLDGKSIEISGSNRTGENIGLRCYTICFDK